MSAPDPMAPAAEAPLRLQRRPGCAWITLNRPAALNSLDSPMIAHFGAALDAIERDPAVRCLVVTGAGRAFCAGGDLNEVQARCAPGEHEAGKGFADYLEALGRLFLRLENLPMPTIAAVNGVALAGGLELVLCCDLVIAADSARFGDVHARHGLLPGGGGSVRLPRRIGAGRAKYLMYTAEQVSAATMQSWGLVQAVVPAGELDAEARRLAQGIAEKSAAGLALMKQLIDGGLPLPIDQALALERQACLRHAQSPDFAEGLAALREQRFPRFGPAE